YGAHRRSPPRLRRLEDNPPLTDRRGRMRHGRIVRDDSGRVAATAIDPSVLLLRVLLLNFEERHAVVLRAAERTNATLVAVVPTGVRHGAGRARRREDHLLRRPGVAAISGVAAAGVDEQRDLDVALELHVEAGRARRERETEPIDVLAA